MKSRKTAVYLFTAFWILVALIIGREQKRFPFFIAICADGKEETLLCQQEEESAYFFIPSYAEAGALTIHVDGISGVSLNGVRLSDGMDAEAFPVNTPMELTYRSMTGVRKSRVTFVTSANIATMHLSVPSDGMEYVHAKKGNATSGTARLYDAQGKLRYDGDLDSIKGRGNSTWLFDKKPYSIKLGTEADLLGTGAAKKWILLANDDSFSQLRNKVAYSFAEDAGMAYTPACDWVDLYVNGTYYGLYLLTERNEIHPQRVNIDADNSFLVSMELEWRMIDQGYPYLKTENGTVLRIQQSTIPEEQMQEIWQSTENAILAEDGVDPVSGKHWTEWIDVDSWAQKYLLEELFGNYDGGSLSQFFYYEESEGKIYAGPVWDMDSAFGIIYGASGENAILAGRRYIWTEEDMPLFYFLSQKEEFMERVVELYQKEYVPLLKQYCSEKIYALEERVEQAAQMDQIRWKVWGTFQSAESICEYLNRRMDFFDTFWFDTEEYCFLHTFEASFPVKKGETVQNFPYMDGEWYLAETGERYDLTAPVYQDVLIVLADSQSEG